MNCLRMDTWKEKNWVLVHNCGPAVPQIVSKNSPKGDQKSPKSSQKLSNTKMSPTFLQKLSKMRPNAKMYLKCVQNHFKKSTKSVKEIQGSRLIN